MKTQLIILLILISSMFVSASIDISTNVDTKKYFEDDTRWTEYTLGTYQNPNQHLYSSQHYLNGDTLIDNTNYKKIFRVGNTNDYYVGALREANGKVYARLQYYDDEVGEYGEFLLYDFTAEVGDRIYSNAKEGSLSYPDGFEVTKIEKIVLENGQERKLFFVGFDIVWIEGVGSVKGLLSDAYWHPTNYSYTELVCFKQNNTQLYKNDTRCAKYDCCDITGILENKQDKAFLYENPIKDVLKVKNEEVNILSITIINQLGQILQTKTTLGAEYLEIDCSEYKSGIYFVKIQNKDSSIQTFKIVKS